MPKLQKSIQTKSGKKYTRFYINVPNTIIKMRKLKEGCEVYFIETEKGDLLLKFEKK